ncbi:hypothetical protein BSZ32_12900 [Rubritalea profundi]|uniref:4Fe-4S ferredoxin-type domain-containing protein n=2 Tax=Rubritalea profundi TaxID=1658618 RepID=A0A2S7U2T4_9BACT|nr:hypothetical protein BSZ32_12900 [Rubritalea profundi]
MFERFFKPLNKASGSLMNPDPVAETVKDEERVAIIQGRFCLAYQRSFCTTCSERCPEQGAIIVEMGVPRVVADQCTGCGICHDVCPAPRNAVLMMAKPNKKMTDNLMSSLSDGTELPELAQGVLDSETLDQLVVDIETCTELLEVIPKFGADSYVKEGEVIDLRTAISMLTRGDLRGVQVRYKHEGSQWWDTLMATHQGVRLVRIQHDF